MSSLIPLSEWLLAGNGGTPVAVDADGAVSRLSLLNRVADWYSALAARPGHRWALYHADPLEFTAALLALWQLGRTACIPGDNRPGTLSNIGHRVDGFIGEFNGVDSLQLDRQGLVGIELPEWKPLDQDHCALEVFTSGSSGEPQAIPKALFQLEREIEALEALWPSERGSVLLSTVSHQHIYGLLFRVLWPLCSGRPFERRLCHYPEDIIDRARGYCQVTLVSSPSHLGRLSNDLDWGELRQRQHYLFSSAAPLSRTVSLNVQSLLGAPVHEIYGSSETGGIAWRVQVANGDDVARAADVNSLWKPLPGVTVDTGLDGLLSLRSLHLPTADMMSLPDRIEMSDNGEFVLKGRTDRIVKVEGKRVSLSAMENCLSTLPWIDAVKCLTLIRHRVEMAAVLQLNEQGIAALKHDGKKVVIRQLRERLQPHFEAVVLPRRWRFMALLPYNRQGKLPLATLEAMFISNDVNESGSCEGPRDSGQLPLQPVVLRQNVKGATATLTLEIPDDLLYFEGHFPGHPILPGVVQIHWAQAYGRQILGVTGDFLRLEVVKFQQVIQPGQTVSLLLEYLADKGKLMFKYESLAGVHASGRICFG